MGSASTTMSPRGGDTTLHSEDAISMMIQNLVIANEEAPCAQEPEAGTSPNHDHGRLSALKEDMKSRLLATVMRVALSPLRMRPRRISPPPPRSLSSWPEVLDPGAQQVH